MKNKFEAPELIIITFNEEDDIITASGPGALRDALHGDDWED